MWFIRVHKITDLTGGCPRRPYDIILSHNTPDVNMRSHLDIFNSLHQNINCTSITKEDNIISQQSLSMHYNLVPPMLTNHHVTLLLLPPSDQSHVKSTLTPFWAALSRCRHRSGARLHSHMTDHPTAIIVRLTKKKNLSSSTHDNDLNTTSVWKRANKKVQQLM